MKIQSIVLSVPELNRLLTIVRCNQPNTVFVSVASYTEGSDTVTPVGNKEQDGFIVLHEARSDAQIMAVAYRLYGTEPGHMGCGVNQLKEMAGIFTQFTS